MTAATDEQKWPGTLCRRLERAAFVALGVAVLLALPRALSQGVNDAEWRTISETGLPSHPEKFIWSAWRLNDGSVTAFRGYSPDSPPDSLPEFRVGHATSFWFAFTAYQGRFERVGKMEERPAVGPGWGAHFRWIWSGRALACAAVFFMGSRFALQRFTSGDDRP